MAAHPSGELKALLKGVRRSSPPVWFSRTFARSSQVKKIRGLCTKERGAASLPAV
jgi:hypothetical protein